MSAGAVEGIACVGQALAAESMRSHVKLLAALGLTGLDWRINLGKQVKLNGFAPWSRSFHEGS
ncbi:hypothetical protein VQ574_20860 (plasmid) [Stutzerimonas frequens]|uniref:hypothetical protein n=1 Tax=Stutzerimonas frequens TaxID=2968969 RepID=UPI002DB6A2E9|nr:hypothetical protein [Stutzerimonas frequens]WRW29391.1 hypothetical protein VQ574_20860 [Stutzerimonas frequens]